VLLITPRQKCLPVRRKKREGDDMAFNNLGPLTFLAPGQTAFWSFNRGGGDAGTQFASADVKTPNQGAVHLADQQGPVPK
jgi:hypothetical protein